MINTGADQQGGMSMGEMFDFAWRLRYWIVASAFACCCLGFLYSRSQTKMYERSAWIMLNNNDGTNNELAMLQEFSGKTVAKKIDNEVFILQTPSMAAKVVNDLGLNYRYYRYGRAVGDGFTGSGTGVLSRKLFEYYKNSPFEITVQNDELLPANLQVNSISVDFKMKEDGSFIIRDVNVNGKDFDGLKKKDTYRFGEKIILEGASVTITRNNDSEEEVVKGGKYICSWGTPTVVAKGFIKNLTVEAQGAKTQKSDVIVLSIKDAIIARAEDFLNTLSVTANAEARAYTNMASVNTINFIDQRLAAIAKDLQDVESEYKNYQSTRALTLHSSHRLPLPLTSSIRTS